MRVETYAGVKGQPGDSDGRRDEATFSFPDIVLEDSKGHLYVGERETSRLRQIRPDGVTRTIALTGQAEGRELALRPSGRIVLSEHNVAYISTEGWLWRASLEDPGERLEFARGPHLALRGFVVENDRIVGSMAGPPGKPPVLVEARWSGGEPKAICELRAPGCGGVIRGPDGRLYLNERERILTLSSDNELTEFAPTNDSPDGPGEPWFSDTMGGMDFDGDGNLYISDTYGHVYSMAPNGTTSIAVDLIDGTTDVLVSSDGHLYVPDYHNHVILRSVDGVTPKGAAK
jgi:hypothetical protein